MSLYFEWRKSCGCRVPCNCKDQPKSKEPHYYFNQTEEAEEITVEAALEAITLNVSTKLPNERIKLDSMLETYILTETAPEYSFFIEYSLFRDGTPLTSESYALINQLGQPDKVKTIIYTAKISWSDTIPLPGTHTYKMEINRLLEHEQNIASVEVQDRSLHAIAFPPTSYSKIPEGKSPEE